MQAAEPRTFKTRKCAPFLQSVSEFKVLNWPPASDRALVAGLPVGIIGLDEKAGFDLEIQTGFVGEVDANAVVAEFSGELYAVDDFAFRLGEAKDFPEPCAEVFAVVDAAGRKLRSVDGTFRFCSSHALLTSGKRCVG